MAKLSIQDGTYSLDGQKLAPGMAIRRYDDAVHMWFEGEVGRTFGYDHQSGQRFEVLNLVVEGYAPSPLSPGQTIEIVEAG